MTEKKTKLLGAMLICVAAIFFMMIIGLARFRESGYFDVVPKSIGFFFFTVLAEFAAAELTLILLAGKLNDREYIFVTFLLASGLLLSLGTVVSLPLYLYSEGDTAGVIGKIAKKCLIQVVLLILTATLVFFAMKVFPKLMSSSRKLLIWTGAVVSIVFLLLLIAAGPKGEYKTTTIAGYQIGAPFMFVMLIQLTYLYTYTFEEKWRSRLLVLGWAGFGAGILAYLLFSEYGLLSYIAAAFVLWYLFYKKTVNRLFAAVLCGVTVIGGGVLLYIYKAFYLRGAVTNGVMIRLMEKIGRCFGDDGESSQISNALSSLRNTGWVGSISHVHVQEASSDFSIVTSVHCCGWIWFIVMLFFIVMAVATGNMVFMQEEKELDGARKLYCFCFIALFAGTIYNILGNLGLTGIIGVSSFASGYGLMNYILSGALLGVLLCSLDTLSPLQTIAALPQGRRHEEKKNVSERIGDIKDKGRGIREKHKELKEKKKRAKDPIPSLDTKYDSIGGNEDGTEDDDK